MGAIGGICATNHVGSGPSTQVGGSTTTESWVHSQQQTSTPSSGSSQSGQIGAVPSLLTRSPNRLHDAAAFNFSTNDFHFSGNDEL